MEMNHKEESRRDIMNEMRKWDDKDEIIADDVVVVDHLCCKICYEPYSESGEKEPRVMKCGHTTCMQCLSIIYRKRSFTRCPFCNLTDHTRPNKLPKNFDIICMLSHYPNLPPNQNQHHLELEKVKTKWLSEKAYVATLHQNSEESRRLLEHAKQHLSFLEKHAHIAEQSLQEAEESLLATEDTLRLLVELHPNDPAMISLSAQLPKVPQQQQQSFLDSIKQTRLRLSKTNRENHRNQHCQHFTMEILNTVPVTPPLSTSISSQHQVPPPRDDSRLIMPQPSEIRRSSNFARSIANAAAQMHQLNNFSEDMEQGRANSILQSTSFSPRQAMLNLIRGGGH